MAMNVVVADKGRTVRAESVGPGQYFWSRGKLYLRPEITQHLRNSPDDSIPVIDIEAGVLTAVVCKRAVRQEHTPLRICPDREEV